MRKPSEYVAVAKARLRDSLIPDCSEVMRHGERSATVTCVGSPSIGEDALMGESPVECVRVLALAADFPALRKGEAVELGQSLRVVTSCKAAIVQAGFTVGLSDAFRKFQAAYVGTRREAGQVRQLKFTLDALWLETGADATLDDGSTSTRRRAYLVYVPTAMWPDVTPPQIGDRATLDDGQNVSVKNVTPYYGHWMLEARTC